MSGKAKDDLIEVLNAMAEEMDDSARERGETTPVRRASNICGTPWCIHCGASLILEWTGAGYRCHGVFEGCSKDFVPPTCNGPIALADLRGFAEDPEWIPTPSPSWFDA